MNDWNPAVHLSKHVEDVAPAVPALGKKTEQWKNRVRQIAPALKHPGYKWLWISSFLSNIGTWMQSLALGWLVFQLTHSSFWLGATAFAFSVPGLLLTLAGGVVADHFSRRSILMVTQFAMMVSAFTLATLVFFKIINLHEIVALTALSGIAAAFNMPAYQSLIPNLVTRTELTNAVMLNSAQFHTARILGPALGGIAIAFVGAEGNFFLNGISFLAPILALALIRNVAAPVQQEGRFWLRLQGGFSYLVEHRQLLSLLLLIAVGSFLALPYMAFLPYFAREVLHSNERGLGALMACSGAGALLGAITVSCLNMAKGRGRFLFEAGLAFFGLVILFCFSRSFILSGVLLAGAGYASVLMGATANAVVQNIVAERVRGRVISIYFTVATGLPPLGGLLVGWLSWVFPAAYVIAAMAGAALVGSAVIFANSSALRTLE